MIDIRALEKRVSRQDAAASAEEFDLLARHYWQLADTEADHREKTRLVKRASHFAGRAFACGMENADTLRFYMEITRRAAALHHFPQDERRKQAKITGRWLELTGAGVHEVLVRAKGRAGTETATFGLGDVGLAPETMAEPWQETALVEFMKQGQRLFFSTGYDGAIKAEIRVIDGRLPVLAAKEYGKLDAATPTLRLEVPSGRIALADMAFMAQPWPAAGARDALMVGAAPGSYDACVYSFSTRRSNRVIAVLCRQEPAPPCNAVKRVDSLFY